MLLQVSQLLRVNADEYSPQDLNCLRSFSGQATGLYLFLSEPDRLFFQNTICSRFVQNRIIPEIRLK